MPNLAAPSAATNHAWRRKFSVPISEWPNFPFCGCLNFFNFIFSIEDLHQFCFPKKIYVTRIKQIKKREEQDALDDVLHRAVVHIISEGTNNVCAVNYPC